MDACCADCSAPIGADWPTLFATSSIGCISPEALFVTRVFVAILFLYHQAWIALTEWNSGFYVIYLTHQSLLIQVIHTCILVVASYLALQHVPNSIVPAKEHATAEIKTKPTVVSVAHALFLIAHPASLVVFVLYWLLDNPVWNLCMFNGDHSQCGELPNYIGLFVHGINATILMATFIVSRIPFNLKISVALFMLYGLYYMIWTMLHHWLKIGTYAPCASYPQDECPIYTVVDWHKTMQTTMLALTVLLVAFPGASAVYAVAGHFRDKLNKLPNTGGQDVEDQRQCQSPATDSDDGAVATPSPSSPGS